MSWWRVLEIALFRYGIVHSIAVHLQAMTPCTEVLEMVVDEGRYQVLDPEQQRGRSQTATAYQFNRAFGTECTQVFL